jgi:hypothetical protein
MATAGVSALLYHVLEAPMIALGNRLTGYAVRTTSSSSQPVPEPTPAP